MPPTTQVQWDGSIWTTVDDDLLRCSLVHGSPAKGNPDRPTLASARGSLTLWGEPVRTAERYALRIVDGTHVYFRGWLQEPMEVTSFRPLTRWQIAGLNADKLTVRSENVSFAAGTVSGLLDIAPLNQLGTIEKRNLPARNTAAFSYRGNLGRL